MSTTDSDPFPPVPSGSFAHLHVASGHSLRYGTSAPEVLVERAAELGMPLLALTDRDGLYGAVRFARACVRAGIGPVLGADLAVRPDGPPPPPATTPARGGRTVDPGLPRVTVLARGGRTGWGALCRLVSAAHGADLPADPTSPTSPTSPASPADPAASADPAAERRRPAITPEAIPRQLAAAGALDGDLLVLLGPGSDVGRAVLAGRPDLARERLRRWRERASGAGLAIEVVHQLAPPGHRHSLPVAARMLGLAREAGLPAVLTNAVRHARPEDAPVADVLDAARRLVPLDRRHLDRANAEGYLKSAAEMAPIAQEVARAAGHGPPAARRLLSDTAELAAGLALDPWAHLGFGSVRMPEPAVLGVAPTRAAAELRARCEAGLIRRYGSAAGGPAAAARLDDELALIHGLGYEAYFLTVAEVVDMVRGMGIRCAARGSGAGSLVNHLLGVSGVDPLRHGLLMERFLSERRTALPDIDLDVESARRTEVYRRLLERFGPARTLCVSMQETYRVRHAVRDVGAALGLPPEEIDAVAKAFPHIRARDVRAALRDLPELRSSRFDQGLFTVLFDLVERLDGLPRQIALHPSGILLSDQRLRDLTPAEPSAQGFWMSQFDKDDVEEIGLLKLDVLGVRMQSAMAYALTEIARTERTAIDLDAVPHDDPATFELIRSTRTLGCFQIESPGQRELIGKFGPQTFEDLITDISLFRPGPVKSDMVTPFLNARQGWTAARYPHPDLEPVLAETEGVVVFHEQVIKVIAVLTGCSHARADQARRALGSLGGQSAVGDWFTTAADRRGYPRPVVERVWEVLRAFASFGFCKAHAAAFALPTYQSAWLKAHHPAAFLAGVLTHDPGMYPKRLILDDARQLGIPILGPDVNASAADYRVEPAADADRGAGTLGIRIGLADVKGISAAELTRITTARQGAPYTSLADFRDRARPTGPTLERLVHVGALDALYGIGSDDSPGPDGRTRRDLLLDAMEPDRPRARTGRRTPGPGQLALQGAPTGIEHPDRAGSGHGLPRIGAEERVRAEIEVLGLDWSSHIIALYEPFLAELGVTRARDLLRTRNRAEILVAGVKVATQTPPVRTGTRVVFATLDDATGPVDLAFFERAQQSSAATVFHSWLLLARGTVRRTGPRGVSLTASAAWDLAALHRLREEQGSAVVRDLLATPRPAAPAPAGHRVLLHPSGFRQSPYADLRPPGTPVASAPRKLWHSSPGSPG
ncbi:DNA polymerase III subunit alpha [Streptomyces sp. NPDC092296]|uniref:DNA polymerase III subunit alpha n=1 Tax=Streptomyces sp. NPDC092296 TaxID=3366012 RepID=UPI00380F4B70